MDGDLPEVPHRRGFPTSPVEYLDVRLTALEVQHAELGKKLDMSVNSLHDRINDVVTSIGQNTIATYGTIIVTIIGIVTVILTRH